MMLTYERLKEMTPEEYHDFMWRARHAERERLALTAADN